MYRHTSTYACLYIYTYISPRSGFAALRGGLIADTFLEVHDIEKHKRGYAESLETAEADIKEWVYFIAWDDRYFI
jgi:hypothetical protein